VIIGKSKGWIIWAVILVAVPLLTGCVGAAYAYGQERYQALQASEAQQQAATQTTVSTPANQSGSVAVGEPTISFTLITGSANGKMAFIGSGGDLEGKPNPDLVVKPGDVVEIVLKNGDGIQHNITVPDFNAKAQDVLQKD